MKTTRVYYNENHRFAAAWLRDLMKRKLIPEGDVDERSIEDVKPSDLRRYTQLHFFAGIAGWVEALRLAGMPDLDCWTGSCPCGPYSSAGKKLGTLDERHLWPEWFRLIRQCRPRIIFGEQVEAAIKYGWLDLVSSNLETEGYAVGAVVLGAHSAGAPHTRQRIYWVADSDIGQRQSYGPGVGGKRTHAQDRTGGHAEFVLGRGSASGLAVGNLADSGRERKRHESRGMGAVERQTEGSEPEARDKAEDAEHHGATHVLGTADIGGQIGPLRREPNGAGGMGHGDDVGQFQSEGRHEPQPSTGALASWEPSEAGRVGDPAGVGREGGSENKGRQQAEVPWTGLESFWTRCEWLPCADGKARPVEPGTLPVADGISTRMELIRGYGNAIVPQVAQAFIEAYLSVRCPVASNKTGI